jgi:lipopolysaccharide export system protein LptC
MNAQKQDWFHDWLTPATHAFSPQRLTRYSRFVGGMKLLLPSLAVGIILILMIWPSSPAPPPPRKVTAMDSTLEAPIYTSRDEKGQPFKLEADVAKQHPTAPGVTDLANPRAVIEMEGGAVVRGDAPSAQYDQKEGKLTVNGNLKLRHSSGAVFETDKAVVDMNAKTAEGTSPVKVTGSFGEVKAQGFQLVDEGKTVIFTGPSHARLKLDGQQGTPTSALRELPSPPPVKP